MTTRTAAQPSNLGYPIPENETQRLELLKSLNVLDNDPSDELNEIVALASEWFSTPIALVSLLDEKRQWFMANQGAEVSETPREVAFCNHTVVSDDCFIVEDALESPLLADNPLVTGYPNIRFYAGVPMPMADGIIAGSFCLIDTKPRKLSAVEIDRLRHLGKLASRLLLNHSRLLKLKKLSEDLVEKNALVAAQSEELRIISEIDPLTKLNNRRSLQNKLDALGKKAVGADLILIDLDGFKDINDLFGHAAGDACLQVVAERLKRMRHPHQFVARMGGDEFAMVLENCSGACDVSDIAGHVIEDLAEPILWQDKSFQLTASLGIATHAAGTSISSSQAVRQADLALYKSKQAGRNCATTYDSAIGEKAFERLNTLKSIQSALSKNELELYYQAKVSMRDGRHNGFEALLRWNRPDGRVGTPASFRCALEDPKLSNEIGAQVIDLALKQARQWHDDGVPFEHIAINTSSFQYRDENFGKKLIAKIEKAGLLPSQIQVEVTEDIILSGSGKVLSNCSDMRAAGISIALDDFGTGFASLTHLQEFPVDVLKIDRSFMQKLGTHDGTPAIIKSVCDLAKNLGIHVVAEGVETEIQVTFLKSIGCDTAQGYLFHRPVSAHLAADHLEIEHFDAKVAS